MKKVVFFAAIALLASCAPREKLIMRGWKFSDVDLGSAKDSASQAFAAMAGNQMKANIQLEMLSDSTYNIRQLKEGEVIRGKWWFSADKKHLFTKTDLAYTDYKVVKLTSKILVIETSDKSGRIIKMVCVPMASPGSK